MFRTALVSTSVSRFALVAAATSGARAAAFHTSPAAAMGMTDKVKEPYEPFRIVSPTKAFPNRQAQVHDTEW